MKRPLAWLDIEATGLDPRNHRIVEVGCIVTTWDASTWMASHHQIVGTHEEDWEIDAEARAMHEASGLRALSLAEGVAQQRESDWLSAAAASRLVGFLRNHAPDGFMLAGVNVSFDRAFIEHYFGHRLGVDGRLSAMHHRMMDVACLGEFVRLVRGDEAAYRPPPGLLARHRVMDDVAYAIAAYRSYLRLLGDEAPERQPAPLGDQAPG